MTSRGAKEEVCCERCQKKFMARTADRKRGWGRFCSKSCKAGDQEAKTGQFALLCAASDDVHPFSDDTFDSIF